MTDHQPTTSTITLKFPLGSAVVDRVTGFAGVTTGFAADITGGDRYEVTPAAKDGEYRKSQWLDAGRLRVPIEELPVTGA